LLQKPWAEVWKDILTVARELRRTGVKTLCMRNLNDILEVGADRIRVRALKTGKPRILRERDFRYVWETLVEKGKIHGLKNIPKVKGRRISAIICAILSHLPYIEGRCEKGRVVLKLKLENRS